MPITQDRMIGLIDAAKEYKGAYERMAEEIRSRASAIARGESDAREMFMILEGMLIADRPPYKAGELIISEAIHFKHRKRINERNRAKISQMRVEARGQGKTYQTSPESPGFGTGTKLLRAKGLKAKGKGRAGLSVDYEATKAKNPGLATVNAPPEDIDFTKF